MIKRFLVLCAFEIASTGCSPIAKQSLQKDWDGFQNQLSNVDFGKIGADGICLVNAISQGYGCFK